MFALSLRRKAQSRRSRPAVGFQPNWARPWWVRPDPVAELIDRIENDYHRFRNHS